MDSNYRRESETQHYERRENPSQTSQEQSTNVPRNVMFYKGLRHAGGYGDRLEILDLTVDYDGEPVPYPKNDISGRITAKIYREV